MDEAARNAGAKRWSLSKNRWPQPSAPVSRSTRRPAAWWWISAAAPRSGGHLAGRYRHEMFGPHGGRRFRRGHHLLYQKKYNLLIGERTAEDIKIRIGSAFPYEDETTMDVKGRNLVDGLPKNITISSEEVREALADRFPPSWTPSAPLWRARRPNCPPTSSTTASCSPAAVPCCAAWTCWSAARPVCRSMSRRTRSTVWRSALASASTSVWSAISVRPAR